MLLLLLATAGLAEDSLYDPAPPPGSAFVRLIAAVPAAESTLGGLALGALEAGGVSAYVPVKAGTHTLTPATGWSVSATVEAGAYYSVVLGPDGSSTVLSDAANDSLAKALVQVYNVGSAADVDLQLADGSVDVIADVAPGGQGHRAVNPIAVSLRVVADGTPTTELADRSLGQGRVYTVVAHGGGEATWTEATTRTR